MPLPQWQPCRSLSLSLSWPEQVPKCQLAVKSCRLPVSWQHVPRAMLPWLNNYVISGWQAGSRQQASRLATRNQTGNTLHEEQQQQQPPLSGELCQEFHIKARAECRSKRRSSSRGSSWGSSRRCRSEKSVSQLVSRDRQTDKER